MNLPDPMFFQAWKQFLKFSLQRFELYHAVNLGISLFLKPFLSELLLEWSL